MALDFPDTPVVGDTYGSLGTSWRWDGTRWASTAGANGPQGRVAYAQVVANQSGIATATALTGMTATWSADPTRTYRTTIRGEVTPTNAGNVPVVEIRDGTTTVKQRWTHVWATTNAASVHVQVVETGLSGSQTRNGYLSMASGTGSLMFGAQPSFPAYILVEDITYEAGTSGVGIEPSAWTNFTMTNGWGAYGGGYFTPSFRKVGNDVQLRGLVAGPGTSTTIVTLPVGYRPISTCMFTAWASASGNSIKLPTRLDLTTSGALNHSDTFGAVGVSSTNIVHLTLDNIFFSTA